MPKIGMEPVRRHALIGATIAEIGALGSLDVTVGTIAKRAGVSSALAHHYFGGKDDLFLAAMREILNAFGKHVSAELAKASTPLGRLEAIISASFNDQSFKPHVIAAWLTFYVQAQSSPAAARLLRIYVGRLHSNLMFNLRALTTADNARDVAQGVAAMIDGFYLRHALQGHAPDSAIMVRLTTRYLSLSLGAAR